MRKLHLLISLVLIMLASSCRQKTSYVYEYHIEQDSASTIWFLIPENNMVIQQSIDTAFDIKGYIDEPGKYQFLLMTENLQARLWIVINGRVQTDTFKLHNLNGIGLIKTLK